MTVISAESVAARLGLPVPLDPAVQARITEAIEDAEAKVVGELHRPIVAYEDTVPDLEPSYTDTYGLGDWHVWPQVRDRYDDVYVVKGYVPAASGDPDLYDVTFTVGLDVANDPALAPIRQFIKQDAIGTLRADDTFKAVARQVTSVSAEGQSVSYATGAGAVDAAGGGLTLHSLRRWKRRAVYQRNARPLAPWPY